MHAAAGRDDVHGREDPFDAGGDSEPEVSDLQDERLKVGY